MANALSVTWRAGGTVMGAYIEGVDGLEWDREGGMKGMLRRK